MKRTHQRSLLGLLGLLLLFPALAWGQTKTVTGIVKDASGESIIGASVLETGTTNGTITGLDGDFTLTVSPSATLTISYVGYVSQVINVSGKNHFDILLKDDSQALEEVVVIGYGVQRKEAVTGSVASVSEMKLKEVPASNISQALQGRVAGVEMSQTSSQPGEGMQIRIRGTRSLTASNDPLVVLDGIPFAGSIGDINPNDIKSIDILKDASATAIYGSRGANGVILVTSFKGTQGAKAQVSYNGYHGVKTLFAKYPMMDGPEFLQLRKDAGRYDLTLDEREDVNTDWQDLMFKDGMVTSHDVGVTGGTSTGGYNFGVGYYYDESLIPTQNFNRISMRGTIDQEIGKYFRFGITTNSNYSVRNGSQIGLFEALEKSPLASPYNEDGSWKRTIINPAAGAEWMMSRGIIEELGDQWVSQSKAFGSYNTLYGELKIPGVEGLKYRANIGLNFRTTNGGSYTGEGVKNSNPENPSTATISNGLTTNWAIENLMTYDRTFNQKHQLNVVALYSAEQTSYNSSRISAKDIPADHFQFYNLGQATGEITINPNDQKYEMSGLMSWMGRVMYSYESRYMISATVRSDASSRLADQWHTYPAVSAGWNIGEESFMEDVTVLDKLKLRAGYGQTSNQAVAPYATLGLLSTRPYNFGSGNTGYATGYYVSKLPNSGLGWEYSETWNYGIDFSLWDGRLSGSLEYYVQDTKDLLLSLDLPSTSGVESYTANIGRTQNKGVELSLNGVILENYNGWSWDAGINLYANRNKLVSLASGKDRDEDNQWFVGYPVDALFDYKNIGLWQEGDPYRDILEPGGSVGMIKVEYTGEYKEDGTPVRPIGPADRQPISMEPDFLGGFNTRVAYKGFDLNVVGAFKCGGLLVSTLHSSTAGYLNLLTGRNGNVKVDYWTEDNTDAKYPSPKSVIGDAPKYSSTLGYFDASYLKVRTISLGYNFDPKKLTGVGINKLRIYLTVQNPFVLFSPFSKEAGGMDPETNSLGDENVAVTSNSVPGRILTIGTNAPSTRNYMLGLNLTF